jgi:hypothetical protein
MLTAQAMQQRAAVAAAHPMLLPSIPTETTKLHRTANSTYKSCT